MGVEVKAFLIAARGLCFIQGGGVVILARLSEGAIAASRGMMSVRR